LGTVKQDVAAKALYRPQYNTVLQHQYSGRVNPVPASASQKKTASPAGTPFQYSREVAKTDTTPLFLYLRYI
jgi:hypothetical protein